jgi:hypothetical protein
MIKKLILPIFAALALAGNAFAADQSGTFSKKKYNIKGSWTLTQVDGKNVIRLSDDFKTKKGPDLKIFLSKKTVGTLKNKPSLIAPLNLGVLKSNKGSQDYIIPANIDLSQYESILIHCEAYNILWGGFDIPDVIGGPAVGVEAAQGYGS